MEEGARKIEIFEPCSGAIELTKKILFQPFDLGKWLVIGFAAFLAGLSDGTRVGFPNYSGGDFKGDSTTKNLSGAQEELISWLAGGVIVAVAVFVLVMVVVFMWLGSRGRFMFIDCIVRNRGAIQEPWREFKPQGDSLFLFSLVTSVASLLLMAILAAPFLISYLRNGGFDAFGLGHVIYLIGVVIIVVVVGIAFAVLVWFMVPVMYRRRCGAVTALRDVAKLMASHPVPFLLFVLFGVVLALAGGILTCVLTCVTCCIAAIPYVGSVILLPLYTFYYAFTLLFLRQFGPDYDVWADVGFPATTPLLGAYPAEVQPPQV